MNDKLQPNSNLNPNPTVLDLCYRVRVRIWISIIKRYLELGVNIYVININIPELPCLKLQGHTDNVTTTILLK